MANLIGYVSKKIFLVALERNIALGIKYDDIDNGLADTIKQSQLKEFIASLPKGIKTRVGESGIRLSRPKQKIAIARSLYHQPRYNFDEAWL